MYCMLLLPLVDVCLAFFFFFFVCFYSRFFCEKVIKRKIDEGRSKVVNFGVILRSIELYGMIEMENLTYII